MSYINEYNNYAVQAVIWMQVYVMNGNSQGQSREPNTSALAHKSTERHRTTNSQIILCNCKA